MKNEILQEVRRNQDKFAKEHNCNLDEMVAALQEMDKHPLTKTVDRRKPSSSKKVPNWLIAD